MLSAVFSRIFFCFFGLALATSTLGIISQVTQQAIVIHVGSTYLTLATPGIQASARKMSGLEKPAPDTTIKYSITKPNNGPMTGGIASFPGSNIFNMKARMDSFIAAGKKDGSRIELDTTVSIIQQAEAMHVQEGVSGSYEPLDEDSTKYSATLYLQKKKGMADTLSDTFSNLRDVHIFLIAGPGKSPYTIKEGDELMNTLQLLPANMGQRILFVFYDIIYLSCIILLLFMAGRLFRAFSKGDYFTLANIKLLAAIGICVLAVQLTKTLFYFLFLVTIHPIKIIAGAGKDAVNTFQYEMYSGVEYLKIFLGLGILILSYIFRNGLRLKEEQALTV